MPPLAYDLIRLALLLPAITLGMLAVKFGVASFRNGSPTRGWVAITCLLLLSAASTLLLVEFGEPLPVLPAALLTAGLASGTIAARMIYTVSPEWTRVLRASERAAAADRRVALHAEQDDLRAEDRVLQVEERADSRAMHDADHPEEDEGERTAGRDAQDANRLHSHGLQDDERAAYRREGDGWR